MSACDLDYAAFSQVNGRGFRVKVNPNSWYNRKPGVTGLKGGKNGSVETENKFKEWSRSVEQEASRAEVSLSDSFSEAYDGRKTY